MKLCLGNFKSWDEWANQAQPDRAACCRFRLYLPSWVPCRVAGDALHRQHSACWQGLAWLDYRTATQSMLQFHRSQEGKVTGSDFSSLQRTNAETQDILHLGPWSPRLPQRSCCTGTQCHEDTQNFPANTAGLLYKHHVYLQISLRAIFQESTFFSISGEVQNEMMVNNFYGLGSSYWFPFPFPFPMICSDAREELFMILNKLVFTMPAISHQASELSPIYLNKCVN